MSRPDRYGARYGMADTKVACYSGGAYEVAAETI